MGLKELFDVSKKELKVMRKKSKQIEALADEYASLTDEDLQGKKDVFKERLEKGETLDDILVEAFATVREASKRVLGLYPFPVQLLGGIALHSGNIAEMRTGEGKSNPIDTPLPTPTGWKTVGDIKLGDYLFDRQGKPTEVIGVYPQGMKDTYELTLKDGRKIKCNSEHLWTVYNHLNDKETLTTQQLINNGLSKDNSFQYKLPLTSAVQYEDMELGYKPYTLGKSVPRGIQFIPSEYLLGSIKQREDLVKGLMTTAGRINPYTLELTFISETEKLAKGFLEVIYSLGFSATYKELDSGLYKIVIDAPDEIKERFFVKSDVIDLEISTLPSEVVEKYNKIAIVSIEKLEQETEQVCFTVDNDEHLFLIGDYIVTHNTLTATMPVYLNALAGKGVHVVTVNEYLSKRDAEDMGELYIWLGLTVGVNEARVPNSEKRFAYAQDITYTTNNELGFDYLKDNMVTNVDEKVQRKLNFAVIDEVDSVLIDEARTPLIISGQEGSSTFKYIKINRLIKTLTEEDYGKDIPTNTVYLTAEGITKIEEKLSLENLYSAENAEVIHFIDNALKANFTMFKDKDYVVAEDKVKIVDSFTGRVMEGRRFSDGLHQALEAKEDVTIEKETRTIASITFQNLFRLYSKLSGMTGTAKTEEEEFRDIYNMQVVPIPTNKPVIREDKIDLLLPTLPTKYSAIVRDIEHCYLKGQPVLVGTGSVEISELISTLLGEVNIPHEVLNAKNHAREADIIRKAGELKSVTIATNMAGRGTDIKLGMGVKDVGGLHVIGTERAESRRIDNQLRGRAGRQGDVGTSQFYLSLEDDLMARFGGDKIKMVLDRFKIAEEDAAIKSKTMMKQVESAQKRVEGNNYDTRKSVLEYDDTMSEQRRIIYEQRNESLEQEESMEDIIFPMFERSITRTVEGFLNGTKKDQWNIEGLIEYAVENEWLDKEQPLPNLTNMDKDIVLETLKDLALNHYRSRRDKAPADSVLRLEKSTVLRVVDNNWTTHIDEIAQLKVGVQLRGYAQENPKDVYQIEAYDMYEAMIRAIEDSVTDILFKTRTLSQNNFRSE